MRLRDAKTGRFLARAARTEVSTDAVSSKVESLAAQVRELEEKLARLTGQGTAPVQASPQPRVLTKWDRTRLSWRLDDAKWHFRVALWAEADGDLRKARDELEIAAIYESRYWAGDPNPVL